MKEELLDSKTNIAGLVDELVSGLVDNQRRLLVLIDEKQANSISAYKISDGQMLDSRGALQGRVESRLTSSDFYPALQGSARAINFGE